MTGQIPIVQLNVEHMRYSMQKAFSQHLLDMDKMFQHAVEQACRPEHVQQVLEDAAHRFLQDAVMQEVKSFFAYGPGREEVKQLVARALTRTPAPRTPEQTEYLVRCLGDGQVIAELLDRFNAYERGEADPQDAQTSHGGAYLAVKSRSL